MSKILKVGRLDENGYKSINEVLDTKGICRTLIAQANNTIPMILVEVKNDKKDR